MPVAGQTPTRVHLIDSESVKWESGAAYVDPNDPTKLVRDVHAHEQEFQLYADDTGAANAYVITLSPAPTIVEGTKFVIKAAHSNTAASTLVVDGASAVAIVKGVSTPLAGGEILANQIFEVTFDGTNYQLAGGATPGGTNHQTQINAAGAFGGVGPGTAGQYLRSGGASADPAYASIAESEVTSLVADLALKAPLASPAFTGTPTAPTPTTGDDSTKLATTAFVEDTIDNLVAGDIPNIAESQVTSLVGDLALKAPLASPALTGTPTAPTAAHGTNTTQLATTAFVEAEVAVGVGLPAVAGITIDGGSSTPLTGSKGYIQILFACTITGWTLLGDASGSAQITVKKCSDAGFPTTASIVASAPPNLSSAQKGESSTLTGWTTAISANDILEFNLDSVTTCKRLTLELKLTRT